MSVKNARNDLIRTEIPEGNNELAHKSKDWGCVVGQVWAMSLGGGEDGLSEDPIKSKASVSLSKYWFWSHKMTTICRRSRGTVATGVTFVMTTLCPNSCSYAWMLTTSWRCCGRPTCSCWKKLENSVWCCCWRRWGSTTVWAWPPSHASTTSRASRIPCSPSCAGTLMRWAFESRGIMYS